MPLRKSSLVNLASSLLGYDFFISYSQLDSPYAEALTRRLEEKNFRVFVDTAEIPVGDSLGARIDRALRHSRAVIVIVSTNSSRSRWVAKEVDLARQSRRVVIPIIIDEAVIARTSLVDDNDLLRIEDPGAHEPSRHTLERLETATSLRRRNIIALRLLYSIAAALSTLAIGVTIAAFRALNEASELRANSIVARAAEVDDPGLAALLLAELTNEKEPASGATTASRLRHERVPAAVLRAHVGAITAATFSHDGKHVLTAGDDGLLVLWLTYNDGPCQFLAREQAAFVSASFHPSDRRVVGCTSDGTCKIWSVDREIPPIVLNPHYLRGANFSRDGERVLAFGGTQAFVLSQHGLLLYPPLDQGTEIRAAVFNSTGTQAVTVGDHGRVCLWMLSDKPTHSLLIGHDPKEAVVDVAFSPDDSRIISASHDSTARIWRTDGEPSIVLRQVQLVNRALFSPNGQLAAIAGNEFSARLWTLDGQPAIQLADHLHVVNDLAFSPDSRYVATASPDQTVIVSDLREPSTVRGQDGRQTSQAQKFVLTGHDADVRIVQFSPNGHLLLTAGADRTVRIWPMAEPPEPRVLSGHEKRVIDLALTSDGKTLASAAEDGTIRIWSLEHHSNRPTVLQHGAMVNRVRFSPDSSYVLSSGNDGRVILWDLRTKSSRLVFQRQPIPIAIAFSHDGRFVVAGSADGVATVDDLENHRPSLQQRLHSESILSARFSKDDSTVVTSSSDGTLAVWRLERQPIIFGTKDSEPLFGADLSPNGEFVASASLDRTLRVYSVRNKMLVMDRGGFDSPFRDVYFPNDKQLITVANTTISLWDLATGSQITVRTEGKTHLSNTAVITPDLKNLITIDGNNVLVSSFDWHELTRQLRASTTDCLTIEQRTAYMLESHAVAIRSHRRCESHFHREQ